VRGHGFRVSQVGRISKGEVGLVSLPGGRSPLHADYDATPGMTA